MIDITVTLSKDDVDLAFNWSAAMERRKHGKDARAWAKVPPWSPPMSKNRFGHFSGKAGEIAFKSFLNDRLWREVLHLDFKVYESGDPGYDFEYNGYRVEIKTRVHFRTMLLPDYQELTAHIYVLCLMNELTKVQILGYQTREYISQHALVPCRAKKSTHKNREIDDHQLLSAERLPGMLGLFNGV